MWGIGKQRSPLGKWIDRSGYNQEDLVKASGVSRNTISKACSDPDYVPSPTVMKKILKALREVDPSARADRFWSL
ncbi:helix-turn-helix transcriptional regulator [Paenibacillus chibensis]|uniref:Helix-turn-helix transcriptional regulator n=1 Tax=Paenibacillus chibensis TaxID=59846 RepID=A0ABU6PPJ8_9BACL|nr:helix-turn-helix transcriptional regulator [Paenibacillus chibensis]